MAVVGINEGTQKYVNFDLSGTVNTQVIAPGYGTLNTLGTLGTLQAGTIGYAEGGTVGTVTSPAILYRGTSGTMTVVGTGNPFPVTLQSALNGTIDSVSVIAGTVSAGTINAATVTAGSIVVTAGTIAAHAITAATITAGTLTNLVSGTINAATAIVNSATISVLPNLPQGSINVTAGTIATLGTMGTLGLVNTVTTVSNITNGSIVMTLGTVAAHAVTAATVTEGTLRNLISGTINSATVVLNSGTINVGTVVVPSGTVTTGTILSSGTTTGVGTITNAGSVTNLGQIYNAGTVQNQLGGTITRILTIGTLEVGTVTLTAQIGTVNVGTVNTGTINTGTVNAGTINIGTVVGNVASGTTDSGNPVKIGVVYQGTAPTASSGQRGDAQADVNFNLQTHETYQPGYEDNTNSVAGVLTRPVYSSTYAPSEYTSFGALTGGTVKLSAGNIYSLFVTSGTTAIRYFQLHNGTTAPALGGTPVASYPMGSVAAGGLSILQLDTTHFAPSRYMSTGISWAMSSTQGTLGTASVTAADVNVHMKYV